MNNVDIAQVFNEVKSIIIKLHDVWEYSEDISLDTYFFEDLGFESIDLVVLAASLEEHFQQSFPFTDFLQTLSEQNVTDLRIGQLIDFIVEYLGTDSREGNNHANSIN